MITAQPDAWEYWEGGIGIRPPLPADSDTFQRMLRAVTSLLELLVDPQQLDRAEIREWTRANAAITKELSVSAGSKEQRQAKARRRFLYENRSYYLSVLQRANSQLDLWKLSDKEIKKLLRHCPFTALLSELFVLRFLDRSNRWLENDLNDMFFFSCGAAYRDFAVGEKRTGEHLRSIQKSLGIPPTVFTTLRDTVEALRAAGVRTATHRVEEEAT